MGEMHLAKSNGSAAAEDVINEQRATRLAEEVF